MAVAVNISSDFKANLAQLPDVDKVAAIELTYKDTGEPCGIANPHKREACRAAESCRRGRDLYDTVGYYAMLTIL
jgi:hypothetical protein